MKSFFIELEKALELAAGLEPTEDESPVRTVYATVDIPLRLFDSREKIRGPGCAVWVRVRSVLPDLPASTETPFPIKIQLPPVNTTVDGLIFAKAYRDDWSQHYEYAFFKYSSTEVPPQLTMDMQSLFSKANNVREYGQFVPPDSVLRTTLKLLRDGYEWDELCGCLLANERAVEYLDHWSAKDTVSPVVNRAELLKGDKFHETLQEISDEEILPGFPNERGQISFHMFKKRLAALADEDLESRMTILADVDAILEKALEGQYDDDQRLYGEVLQESSIAEGRSAYQQAFDSLTPSMALEMAREFESRFGSSGGIDSSESSDEVEQIEASENDTDDEFPF